MEGWCLSSNFLKANGKRTVDSRNDCVLNGKVIKMTKSNLTTLCYIEKDNQYLMMHRIKKKNDINQDKWVGVGGHFEKDETPEECLCREVLEETGLCLTKYQARGMITFMSDRWQTEYMYLYTASEYTGELIDCEEGTLEWIDKKDVYDLPIWEGDKDFFRLLEQDTPFFFMKLRYVGEQLVEKSVDLVEQENLKLKQKERTQKVVLMNMCMISDGDGNVLALDKVGGGYTGMTFPGGHVEDGESFADSVIREVKEETGLTIMHPILKGIYHWYEGDIHNIGYLYWTDSFEGQLVSSNEGKVYWISEEEYAKMELAHGMDKVLRIMSSEEFSECYFHDGKEVMK